MIAISTSAVPRSPCSTTSAVTRPVTGTIGIRVCFQSPEHLLLAGVQVGAPQDDRQLGQLGGLDGHRAERQPVAVAVDGEAERGAGEVDQHHRRQQRRPGEDPQHPVRQPRGDERDGQRQQHPGQLLEEDVVAVAEDPVGVDARGAEHLHQPDGQQQRRGAQQQVVRRERPVEHVADGPADPGEPSLDRPALLPCRGGHAVSSLPSGCRAGRPVLTGRGGGVPTPRRHPRVRRSS